MHWSWFVSATVLGFGSVRVNGNDYQCARFYFNNASEHMGVSCSVLITGLASGSYTAQGRYATNNAADRINMDANDQLSMTVQETD
jgi:hypothetical protein